MAEDYYDEADSGPSTAQDAGSDGSQGDENAAPAQSTLIPKSMCPGMKPGDEVTLRIDKELEDEYQVSYPGKEKEPEGDEPEMGETEPEPSDAMME